MASDARWDSFAVSSEGLSSRPASKLQRPPHVGSPGPARPGGESGLLDAGQQHPLESLETVDDGKHHTGTEDGQSVGHVVKRAVLTRATDQGIPCAGP